MIVDVKAKATYGQAPFSGAHTQGCFHLEPRENDPVDSSGRVAMARLPPDFWVNLRFEGPPRGKYKLRAFRLKALSDYERVPNAYHSVLKGEGGLGAYSSASKLDSKAKSWAHIRNKLFLVIPDSITETQLEAFLKRIVKNQYAGFPDSLVFWRSEV